MWFTCRMSMMARYLLIAGVLLGMLGTGAYITDTWITGDGSIAPPGGFAGTCLGIGLLLAGLGMNIVMRYDMRARRK